MVNPTSINRFRANAMSMILFALILGLLGLILSASFSGSETAFYRIPKLRLKLDAMENDPAAKRLLWLVNRPSFFVATILVGNNVANYTVSLATVLFVGAALPRAEGIAVEIASTLLLAPFLFVYGEMFPKYLSLRAPNRILRFLLPVLTFFFRLFLPLTCILWLLNQLVAKLLGRSREMLELTLGRQELSRMLDEGQETGILFGAQRRLADGVFDVSNQSIGDRAIPASNWPRVTGDFSISKALEIARRFDLVEIPVYERESYTDSGPGELPIGYVRTIDLEMAQRDKLDEASRQLLLLFHTELPIRSTVEISSRHSLLTAMILMQTLQGSFGCVIGEHRECIGFVRADDLRDLFLHKVETSAA